MVLDRLQRGMGQIAASGWSRGKEPWIMAQLPRISVVIPALNEAACLVRLHQELDLGL